MRLLMFCINVVSCYTELSRKGILLNVVNGKKRGGEGNSNFPTRIEPLERFSLDCRKTKTKVITLANHKGHRQYSEPIKTRSNYM